GVGEHPGGEAGAALLVVGALWVVDGVVEPGGQADDAGGGGVLGQLVHEVEDGVQVGAGVVAAVRLAVALIQFCTDMPSVRSRKRDPPVNEIHGSILTDRRTGRGGARPAGDTRARRPCMRSAAPYDDQRVR